MDIKNFAYSLNKILSEEIPLQFNVREDNRVDSKGLAYTIYGVEARVPDTLALAFDRPKCYIGMDDYKDNVDVYIKCGLRGYKDFGKFDDPLQVLKPIEAYLMYVYGDILKLLERRDFFFSQELHDFLQYNSIKSTMYRKGQPHLLLDHPNYPITYNIDFSEYKGDVLVEVEKWDTSELGYKTGKLYEGDQTIIYKSDLSLNNQQKVFAEILKELKKEGF